MLRQSILLPIYWVSPNLNGLPSCYFCIRAAPQPARILSPVVGRLRLILIIISIVYIANVFAAGCPEDKILDDLQVKAEVAGKRVTRIQ